jgi:hypothetical protein
MGRLVLHYLGFAAVVFLMLGNVSTAQAEDNPNFQITEVSCGQNDQYFVKLIDPGNICTDEEVCFVEVTGSVYFWEAEPIGYASDNEGKKEQWFSRPGMPGDKYNYTVIAKSGERSNTVPCTVPGTPPKKRSRR